MKCKIDENILKGDLFPSQTTIIVEKQSLKTINKTPGVILLILPLNFWMTAKKT